MKPPSGESQPQRDASGDPEERRKRHDSGRIVDQERGKQRRNDEPEGPLEPGWTSARRGQEAFVAGAGPPSFRIGNRVRVVAPLSGTRQSGHPSPPDRAGSSSSRSARPRRGSPMPAHADRLTNGGMTEESPLRRRREHSPAAFEASIVGAASWSIHLARACHEATRTPADAAMEAVLRHLREASGAERAFLLEAFPSAAPPRALAVSAARQDAAASFSTRPEIIAMRLSPGPLSGPPRPAKTHSALVSGRAGRCAR